MTAWMYCDDVIELAKRACATRKPFFLYGHIDGPYDGCFWLNTLVFVKDDRAYLSVPIAEFARYRKWVADPLDPGAPDPVLDGCVLLKDLPDVLDTASSKGYEAWSMEDLVSNIPNMGYRSVIEILNVVYPNLPAKVRLRCADCAAIFTDADDVYYYECMARGNGGMGIELDAPVCQECQSLTVCSYCGDEYPRKVFPQDPERNDWVIFSHAEGEERCCRCAEPVFCALCGEVVQRDPYKPETWDECNRGVHDECTERNHARILVVRTLNGHREEVMERIRDEDPNCTFDWEGSPVTIWVRTNATVEDLQELHGVVDVVVSRDPAPTLGDNFSGNLFEHL